MKLIRVGNYVINVERVDYMKADTEGITIYFEDKRKLKVRPGPEFDALTIWLESNMNVETVSGMRVSIEQVNENTEDR